MFRCSHCGALNRVPAQRPEGAPSCGKCHQALDVSGAPQAVDGDGLKRLIASSAVPVLVDIWAPWCGPCRAVAPILEQVGREHAGRLLVVKLNSDEHQDVASRLGVQGIPTFIVYANGREAARQSGAMPKHALLGWLQPFLAGAAHQNA